MIDLCLLKTRIKLTIQSNSLSKVDAIPLKSLWILSQFSLNSLTNQSKSSHEAVTEVLGIEY
jgi:hypothetical protein